MCSGQPGSPDHETKKPRESAGLDLSFKRDDDDHETDTERDEANTNEEERNEDSDDGNVSKQSYQGGGGGGGRSRRKPAAPQWVNPFLSGDQETEAKEESGDSRTINGVCVVNFPGHRDNGDMETEAGELTSYSFKTVHVGLARNREPAGSNLPVSGVQYPP